MLGVPGHVSPDPGDLVPGVVADTPQADPRLDVLAHPRSDPWPDDVPGCGQRRSVLVPAAAGSVHTARLLVVAALADWGVIELADDVSGCVAELVGNAYRHAHDTEGSMVRLSLHLLGRCLSVHVRDRSDCLPVLRSRPKLDETGVPDWTDVDVLPESGFGLHLVQGLADGWCWWPLPVGKVVTCWFTVGGGGVAR